MVGTVDKDVMTERELLLESSRAITLRGRDKMGRAVVRIVGKHFPGKLVSPWPRIRSAQIRSVSR